MPREPGTAAAMGWGCHWKRKNSSLFAKRGLVGELPCRALSAASNTEPISDVE
jgi:hypothetical protein